MKPGEFSAFLLCAALLGPGCDRKEDLAEPTEPWLRGQDPNGAERSAPGEKPRSCKLAPGARLALSLSGSGIRGKGSLPVTRGELLLDERALGRTSGYLEFSLEGLEFSDEAGARVDEWASEAHRWLGLGKLVSASERARRARARVDIDHVRAPSSGTLSGAVEVSGADGKKLRQVTGVAETDLSLGPFVVHHPIDVRARFAPGGAGGESEIVVDFARPARVALREHEIVPRDERGAEIAAAASLVGREVGSLVGVTGQVTFLCSADAGGSALVP